MAFPLIVPLVMAAAGALIDKKKPLRGAMIGGSMGLGGFAAGGLLGGASGAAGGAAGAGGAAAGTGGLLAGGQQAAMLAAQNAGLGAGATSMTNAALMSNPAMYGAAGGFAPIVEMGTQAAPGSWSPALTDRLGNPEMVDQFKGMLGKVDKYGKPISNALQATQSANNQQAQIPQPQPLRNQPLDLNGVLAYGQQMRDWESQEAARKRAQYMAAVGRIGAA